MSRSEFDANAGLAAVEPKRVTYVRPDRPTGNAMRVTLTALFLIVAALVAYEAARWATAAPTYALTVESYTGDIYAIDHSLSFDDCLRERAGRSWLTCEKE